MRYSWIWTVLLLLAVLAVLLVTFVFPDSGMRPYVVIAFLLSCPGIALVRTLNFPSHPARMMTLATALSIALDAIFAAIFLYAGFWFPSLILMTLVWFTLTCVLLQLLLIVFRKSSLKSVRNHSLEMTVTLPQTRVVRQK